MGDPILTGAAIGGGLGLMRGKGITGGLQGAALGAAGGGLTSALQTAAAAPIVGAAPSTAGAFEASMGLPSSAMIGAGAPLASAMPTGAGMGLSLGNAGNMINKDYFALAGTPFETYTGGQGLLANASGNLIGSMPDYVTPKNVLGAVNLLAESQAKPTMQPQSGQVRQGSTQGLNVNMSMAAPVTLRKREDF